MENEEQNEKKEPIDAIYCNGKVGNQEAIIIIDSGAVSNIVTHSLLKKNNLQINKPSNINLVGINGIKERPLGEVIDLPITLGNKSFKVNALVTEKGDYDLLLGNNWAYTNKAILDWKKASMTFEINNEKVNIPVSCLKKRELSTEESNKLVIQNDKMEIKVFTNYGKGKIPERTHEEDAGFDIKYPGVTILNIPPKEVMFVNTWIAMEIPKGSYCQLKSRSSLAKKGIEVKAGTIDAGYTGDIGILLYNNTGLTYQIRPNEKIAQAIFSPILNISAMKEVSHRKELEQTSRGQQDFGSTDKKEKEYEEEYKEEYE